MISINLDLDDFFAVLRGLQDPAVTRSVIYAMAERYNDDIHDWIDAGRGFALDGEGHLQQSINWEPLGEAGAAVYANADYAPYVEFGTGIPAGHEQWVIGPKEGRKALKIPVTGGAGYIFRRSVIHKGSRPKPYFFADLEGRKQRMLEAGRERLAQRINAAIGD